MAIHTLSIGGTSYEIQPKYASSAGYATTAGYSVTATMSGEAVHAGRADIAGRAVSADNAVSAAYASRAGYADSAGRAVSADNAVSANQAATVLVCGNNTSTNFPLLLAASVAVTAGAAKELYTDTANSLHYNPSTNVLTAPSLHTSAPGAFGGVTIYDGSNFNLRAASTAATNPGDIIFQNSSGTELGRLWLDSGTVFSLRYGSTDDAKEIIHSGNIGSQSVSYASSAGYATTAGRANYASSAGSATTAGSAVLAAIADVAYEAHHADSASYASRAVTAAHAVTANFAGNAGHANTATYAAYVRTNQSTSTFYIVGTTTSASATTGFPLIKNSAVKVQSNAVYASAGFYESSDARLKTITSDVEVDFERLKSIPKIQYIKKGETAPHIGTIAQDLQKVYPEFVETGDDGYMSVDYAKLSIIPLKAVDLLYDEMNKLKDEIKTVKEENQMLKDRLDNIEAIINK